MLNTLQNSMKNRFFIGDIAYPSRFAKCIGLGSNYLAVCGDGLVMALFEMVTDGILRLHYCKDPHMSRYLKRIRVHTNDRITIERLNTIIKRFLESERRRMLRRSSYYNNLKNS